ncbi:hypothetical protein [Microbulbifer variabilis]|uniref:hypothetical protein n=1 Tax=Microbulbifer variabilis TaxID=266805 RepID=UPI00036B17A2|nr:hypothetical protein [Microbulbifer variabilis]
MNKVHVTFLIGLFTSGVAVAESFHEDVGIGVTSPQATLHIKDSGTTNPAILISGASSEEGDIAVLNNDTLQIGNWIDSTETYIEWLSIDTSNVNPSANNNYADETTKTRMKLIGDNSHSTIFHYSGYDSGISIIERKKNEDNCESDKEEDREKCYYIPYREELALKAHSDSVSDDSNGAGAHFYGDMDSQHAGWIGFFTGGKTRLSINQQGRVGIGSKNLLVDYENHYKGRFNIIIDDEKEQEKVEENKDEPALYIERDDSTKGYIAWKPEKDLTMGTWEASAESVDADLSIDGDFNEIVRITSTGNFSVQNPIKNDDSPGYIQLDTSEGTPPDSDCNSSSDVGRMTMHKYDSLLYVCASSGWKSLPL